MNIISEVKISIATDLHNCNLGHYHKRGVNMQNARPLVCMPELIRQRINQDLMIVYMAKPG